MALAEFCVSIKGVHRKITRPFFSAGSYIAAPVRSQSNDWLVKIASWAWFGRCSGPLARVGEGSREGRVDRHAYHSLGSASSFPKSPASAVRNSRGLVLARAENTRQATEKYPCASLRAIAASTYYGCTLPLVDFSSTSLWISLSSLQEAFFSKLLKTRTSVSSTSRSRR